MIAALREAIEKIDEWKAAEKALREAHSYCLCLCVDMTTEDELGNDHECTDGRCGMLCCKNAHAAIDRLARAAWLEPYERMGLTPEVEPAWLPKGEK
jgi:hypothetical protein